MTRVPCFKTLTAWLLVSQSSQVTWALQKQPFSPTRSSPLYYRGGATKLRVAKTRTLEKHNSDASYNASAVDAGSTSLGDLWNMLASSSDGLTSEQAKNRLGQYGANELKQARPRSIWSLVAEQFEDRLVQILLAVAVLSAVFSWMEVYQQTGGDAEEALWKAFVEPTVILAILVLNAAVGVWQGLSAADSLAALQKLQAQLSTVLRDGIYQVTNAVELVPGDVIQVRVGDKIPADSRLVSYTSILTVDEGSLTGESATVNKYAGDEGTVLPNLPVQDQKGMLYAGTVVTRGSGVAVVVQTGGDTQFGRIQKGVTEAEAPKTPLAMKLDDFGQTLTVVIAMICFAVWIVSIPKMNDPSFGSPWKGALYYAKVAVALGVAAIPEGLPAVITLCLSLGTRRMAKRNVIVRKLQAVETLGCTSVICTDKTGTLTTNEMTAVSLVLIEKMPSKSGGTDGVLVEHSIEGFSYSPVGSVDGVECDLEVKRKSNGAVADVAAVCALCNDASIVGKDEVAQSRTGKKEKTGRDKEKVYERIGEPTEAALCVLAEKLGGMSHYLEDGEGNRVFDRKGLHVDVPPSILASANVNSWRKMYCRLATLEFSRDRKSMSVLCNYQEKNGNRLYVKGAPNLLLDRCSHMKLRDGSIAKLTGELRRTIESKLAEMSARPLRCLALAVKDTNHLESSLKSFNTDSDAAKHPLLSKPENYRNIESGLTLVGFVGIKDPARPEVAESINQCTAAGIRIMMITGDAKDTAVAIARDVNIFPPAGTKTPVKAFEGREFFSKTKKEQLEILKEDNIVFCRAEPSDKQKLIQMLQSSLNEITAMTGDGVNDAPALRQASIGLAMGITGTEVSKEASDMVLADDNFSTIVAAIEEGRRIYANMQSFICFLISCNIGEICAIFFATLAGFPEPLTAMHLLWVNLVTDGPPATALGFNPPSPGLMAVPPRPSNEPIMTKWLLLRYVITGAYVGVATIGVFAQHYLSQGVGLVELSSWSQCGQEWHPPTEAGTCAELFQGKGRMLPQTLSLTTLVSMEMLKALSAVSVDSSIFRVGPQSNPWLIGGVTLPFLLHLSLVYSSTLGFPSIGESFGMVPLSTDNWMTVLYWAMPILVVDEILKAIGRRRIRENQPKAHR